MVKMVAVEELTVGDIISDVVHTMSGKVLLNKDIALTSRHISLLNNWNIKNVSIRVEAEEGNVPLAEISSAKPSAKHLEFYQEYNSILTKTSQSFDMIRKRKMIPVSHLKDTAGNIYASISNNNAEVMNYLLINEPDLTDFVSSHSVMVAYLSGIVARQMGWNEDDIAGVAFASLLHDIGNLGNGKSHELHEQVNFSEMSSLLRETRGLSSEVLLGIIQHRERNNGSGLPQGTPGPKIHPYAKIIAVADFFHNLVSGDHAANPFPILDVLTREMYDKFDPNVCQNFIQRVRDSLLFNKIVLSTGQEAEIIFFNRDNHCSPIVRTEDGQILDLSKRSDVTISKIVTFPRQ